MDSSLLVYHTTNFIIDGVSVHKNNAMVICEKDVTLITIYYLIISCEKGYQFLFFFVCVCM